MKNDLYQKQPNCVFFTDEPLFDTKDGKQIQRGIEIKLKNGNSGGLFRRENFEKESEKIWKTDDFFYSREIVSTVKIKQRRVKK